MGVNVLKTSVVIIGAGPAGAATSFFLSKFSIPHIVIEKEIFPRDKVCGDACSGKTSLVINRANPDWLKEIHANSKEFLPALGIVFAAPNGKKIDIPFDPNRTPESKPPGFTVSRLVFDNFLFEKMVSSYCTIFQNAKVEDINRIDEGVSLIMKCSGTDYQIEAPVIVGADGDKSLVRKNFSVSNESPKSYAVGLRGYYDGVTGFHEENFIELHFLKEILPGYLWIFPMPNGKANVGVCALSDVVRKKKINLRQQMLDAINYNPQIAPRFKNAQLIDKIKGWGLPMATERLPISGDNFLLVGDAASLVDPFSGEGIGNAMYSGMLAATALNNVLGKGDFSAGTLKREYDDVFFKRIGQELKVSAAMQRLCNYGWLFNMVVNKASKSAELRNTISSMFADIDMRGQLKKPSFYFNILFNK